MAIESFPENHTGISGNVLVVGAIRGLVREGERVARLLKNSRPDALGLSVSKEGLGAMEIYLRSGGDNAEPSNPEEVVYVRGLSVFGEVQKPPPCFVEAWLWGVGKNVPLLPLDMDDDRFTDAYCRNVSGLEVVFMRRRERRIVKHVFNSSTPTEFVIEWDSVVNNSRGFKALELERERWMARGICQLAKSYSAPAAVVEIERVSGIEKVLIEKECDYKIELPD